MEAADYLSSYLCGAELDGWVKSIMDAQMWEGKATNRRQRDCIAAAKGDQSVMMACGEFDYIARYSPDLMQGRPSARARVATLSPTPSAAEDAALPGVKQAEDWGIG